VNPCVKASFLVLCLAASVSACDWGKSADTGGTASEVGTSSTAEGPTVESSLEGLTVLPPRIDWSATTSLPPEQVETVKFLVDGDTWWEDSTEPYTYGPPGASLPVRWISSLPLRTTGRPSRTHEFAVRVKATNGEKWESTPIRARTPEATHARLPRGLAGPYGPDEFVRLSPARLAHPPPPTKLPSFAHFLVFRGSSLFVRGGGHDAAWEISGAGERLNVGTPIFLSEASHADASDFNGVDEVICAPQGPPATYKWSETSGRLSAYGGGPGEHAQNLELRAVKDPCRERRQLLEGVWEGIVAG
jgi:hypothetical protein